MDQYADKYEGMTLAGLAMAMAEIRAAHDNAKAVSSRIWSEHEYLAKRAIPETMEAMGLTSCNLDGIGRLEIRHDVSVSIPPENKQDVYVWVQENGYGDLIQGTINSSTFKAQVKKWVIDGEDFPIELIKYTPFDNAVLIKAK